MDFLPAYSAQAEKWQYGGMVYHKHYRSYSVCFFLLYIIVWSQQLWSLQWNFVNVTRIYRGWNRKIFLMLSNTSCSKTVKCWISASGRYIDLFKFAVPQTSVLVTLVEQMPGKMDLWSDLTVILVCLLFLDWMIWEEKKTTLFTHFKIKKKKEREIEGDSPLFLQF